MKPAYNFFWVKIATKYNPKTYLKFELFLNFVFTLEQETSFCNGIKSYRSNFCKNRVRFCFSGTKELWSNFWGVFKSNRPTKLIRILVLLEKFFKKCLFRFVFLRKQLKYICGGVSFRSWVKKFILRVKVESVCNALSPVKLSTSAVLEVCIFDRFWDEMLDACNEVTLVKYSFTSSR